VAERPHLRPYIEGMEERLAAALGVDAEAINVKATTAEQMGALGRAEGIQAQAIVRIVANR
jgi:2-C-methyl-D-erythritol 2,4-cyclodiphosphate synthase